MPLLDHSAEPLLATLCFSTLGCGELELEDVLKLARCRGIPSVELRTLGGHNDLVQYFESRYGTPERLRSCVAASRVRIASLDSSCSVVGSTPGDRAELMALAEWTAAAGAGVIRVFDGGERGGATDLAAFGPLLGWWRTLDLSVALLVETHDALADPAVLQSFVDKYPQARILWDTFHTWHDGGEAPSATWMRLRHRTSHIHVKDSDRQCYVPPGDGAFPFDDLIGALRRDQFQGVVSLEWERHWFPDLPPIDVALDGFARVFHQQVRRGHA